MEIRGIKGLNLGTPAPSRGHRKLAGNCDMDMVVTYLRKAVIPFLEYGKPVRIDAIRRSMWRAGYDASEYLVRKAALSLASDLVPINKGASTFEKAKPAPKAATVIPPHPPEVHAVKPDGTVGLPEQKKKELRGGLINEIGDLLARVEDKFELIRKLNG